MTNPKLPSLSFCIGALKDLVDFIPEQEQPIDWKTLLHKREIAVQVIDYLNSLLTCDQYGKGEHDCSFHKPLIFNMK